MFCVVYILLIWFLLEYPTERLMRLYIFINLYINVFLGVEGRSCFKRNSVEILVEFQVLEYFLKFRVYDRSGWVPIFQTG